MRITTALVLSLIVSSSLVPLSSAFADDKTATPTATAKFSEPNLKASKESGGKTTSPLILDAPLRTDFVKGSPTAPITMVEYASLSCPHCAHFATTVLPTLDKEYISTGKMRYILRPFPLNEAALKASMMLDCIGEQNPEKYYVFAKVLFDAQSKWAFDSNYMAGLETIATVGGLTKDQFQNCTNTTEREIKILKLKKDAEDEIKIPHTPYIFVGDEAYEGDRAPEAIKKFIDKKIEQAQKVKAAQ